MPLIDSLASSSHLRTAIWREGIASDAGRSLVDDVPPFPDEVQMADKSDRVWIGIEHIRQQDSPELNLHPPALSLPLNLGPQDSPKMTDLGRQGPVR